MIRINQACYIDGTGIAVGRIYLPSGDASLPSLSAASDTNTGIYFDGADSLFFTTAGTAREYITDGSHQFRSTMRLVWTDGAVTGTQDLILGREAAATLQLGADAAGVTNQLFKGPDRITSDGVGGNLTIAGGRNRGASVGGSVIIQTSPVAGAGVAGTLADVATFASDRSTTLTGALNLTQGTITTATNNTLLNLTSTWNEGSTTFAGIKYVLTDTASASGSLPFQILGGASGTTNLFSVRKDGTQAAVNFAAVATGGFYIGSYGALEATGDGAWRLRNNGNTGFTALNLGPTTGNTSSGSTSITHVNATIDMATATGTGTGTITVANFIPANAIVIGLSARVTTILAGAALTTWSIGPSTDLDMWGTTLALAAGTLVNASNYTITSGGGVINSGAATNLALTAAAGVFSTGVVKVTLSYFLLTPISA